eukprot:9011566-Pyramimonas_sp.AAC.1
MGVDICARRLTRAQTHSQSDSLALTLTRSHSLAHRPVVFVRVVCPATHVGTPLTRSVAPQGAWAKMRFILA